MPYAPQTWLDSPDTTTPLSAARLTHMETGIEDADTRLTAVEGVNATQATELTSLDGRLDTLEPAVNAVASVGRHSDLGWLAASYDPAVGAGQSANTAGRIQVAWVPIRAATTITRIAVVVTTAGASLTAGAVGLAVWDAATKALLRTTAIANTDLQSTGVKEFVVNTPGTTTANPLARAAGGHVYIGVWANGTTMPTMARASLQILPTNANASGNALQRGAMGPTGQTSGTAPDPLGALTNDYLIWAGAS